MYSTVCSSSVESTYNILYFVHLHHACVVSSRLCPCVVVVVHVLLCTIPKSYLISKGYILLLDLAYKVYVFMCTFVYRLFNVHIFCSFC